MHLSDEGPRACRRLVPDRRTAAGRAEPVRPGQHPPDASPERGAARARALPQGCRIHRPQWRSHHRRRVHRPHDAGPPLVGWPAPVRRGEGRRARARGKPDGCLDHVPELLPHVRQAFGHDRHGRYRGFRVPEHLRSRGRRDPDAPADDPRRRGRPRLPDAEGQVRSDHRGHPRVREKAATRARRHHVRRDVGVPLGTAEEERHPARSAEREAARA